MLGAALYAAGIRWSGFEIISTLPSSALPPSSGNRCTRFCVPEGSIVRFYTINDPQRAQRIFTKTDTSGLIGIWDMFRGVDFRQDPKYYDQDIAVPNDGIDHKGRECGGLVPANDGCTEEKHFDDYFLEEFSLEDISAEDKDMMDNI